MAKMGRPQKYPWDEWFKELDSNGFVRLQAGIDFAIPPETMRRSFLAEANRRDLTVKSRLQQGRRFIRFEPATRRRDYPWDVWLDGGMHQLIPGVDFDVYREVMREQCRRAAKARGLALRSKLVDGALWVQALPADSNAFESEAVRSGGEP